MLDYDKEWAEWKKNYAQLDKEYSEFKGTKKQRKELFSERINKSHIELMRIRIISFQELTGYRIFSK